MCGVVAAIVDRASTICRPMVAEVVRDAFNVSHSRGPEASRLEVLADGNVYLGLHRLAINGAGESGGQPLNLGTSTLVCNGEIYNHKELVAGSTRDQQTSSDCEAVVHALSATTLKSGLASLDGVFALCMYDTNTRELIVARDTFGVRPLFRGCCTISDGTRITMFASEMKHLVRCDPQSVDQFPPGTYARYSVSTGRVRCLEHTAFRAGLPCQLSDTAPTVAIASAWVRNALEDAVWKRVNNTERPVACLLSGGLDSTIVATLAAKCLAPVKLRTFAIGMTGSPDLEFARVAAAHIGADHTEVLLTPEDFLDAIPAVIRAIESYDTTTVRASVGNYLVAKHISENTDCKVVLNGDGADEVAGGYVYFRAAPSNTAFDMECRRLVDNIHMYDVLRSDRCMGAFGLEARTPFLDVAFVSAYMQVPAAERVPAGGIEKNLLREVFRDVLPPRVVSRKKEAFSDGVSSHENSWHTIIERHLNVVGEPSAEVQGITPNPPTTREMALYRTIFEDVYPGCGHVIPRFWMPRWVDAVDASARTLEIY
jgi:asparagine synthase (glutamine-hydrolysing)